MYQVVCSRTLEKADDVKIRVFDFAEKKDAVSCFNEQLTKKIKEAIDNEFLHAKMSMHHHRALIQFEGTHYLIAIVKDGGIFDIDTEI